MICRRRCQAKGALHTQPWAHDGDEKSPALPPRRATIAARHARPAPRRVRPPAVAHAASAVAVLTTKPSGKSDGWNPRSVKAADSSNACAAGVSLCAVLVLRDTVRRFGNVPDADFVAMVDAPCPEPLKASLEANAIVAEEMDFGTYGKLFGDYLLMRKFYVLKMTRYDKVLLLDTDTIAAEPAPPPRRDDLPLRRRARPGPGGARALLAGDGRRHLRN
ncbi:hypothetical protein JL720_17106 [Aureococcus anophagefferens]|nr:hypothetical protein JL720_17106 [Aureococcus anophagefferens]